jgi:DNA repair protein RecN (Recombination protein N)
MIQTLSIENLVLIRNAEVAFGPGLNILTGETGAGKSAFLAAIRLALGERADGTLIRQGADRATVEARLCIVHQPIPGIDLPTPGQPLTIRREIYRSGKSRCFLEDQLVSLHDLKTCLGRAVQIIDQNSALRVCDEEEQRFFLDTFGQLQPVADSYRALFESWRQAEERLADRIARQQSDRKEESALRADLQFLEEVNWKEDEEERLALDHTLLARAQEFHEKISSLLQWLTEGSAPSLSTLKRSSHQLDSLASALSPLQEAAEAFKRGVLEIDEATHLLTSFLNRLDSDPGRLRVVEQRLEQIEKIKRRFSPRWAEVQERRESLQQRLKMLDQSDDEIEAARTDAATLHARVLLQAAKLTQKRERAALQLSTEVTRHLRELNLPHASFVIAMQPKPLSPNGADALSFRFAANPHQPLLAIGDAASGGEQSRLLFCIHAALAQSASGSALIFDEIDSSIGGQTAAILGAKLKAMAQERQLICVTHFVQVAQFAFHHFLVSKHTDAEGAATSVKRLDETEKKTEYTRMLGAFPLRDC